MSIMGTLIVMGYFDELAAYGFQIVNLFGYFLMFILLA